MMKLKRRCDCSKLIAAIDNYIAKANDRLSEGLKDAGFALPKKTTRKINDLEDELAKILRADTKYILNTINDYDDLEDFIDDGWPGVKDGKDVVEKISATFSSRFSEDIPEYAAEYLKRVESDAVLDKIALTHETTSWISSWSDQLGQIMKLTDNNIIEKILTDGLKNGDSIVDTAKKISDAKIRDPGYRARRVAITETLRAHSVAQQESFMQSPAVEMKLWRHSGWREYARENHMAIDGQTVRKDEPFTLFGADGAVYYPRDVILPPGESINCGCIAEPIVSDYVLGLSLEERNQLRDEAISEMNEEFDRTHGGTQYAANAAIRNTGKEVYYNKNANYSIKLDGYSDDVNNALSNAAENVAKKGSADRCEHMHLVNLNTGDWSYYETNGEPDAVGYDFWDELDKNPGEQYAFVHNHNKDSSFSETDMQTLLGTPQIPVMIAVRNDGVSYVAERTGNTLDDVFLDNRYIEDISKINERYRSGEITASQRSYEREMVIVDNALRDFTKGMVEFDGREK